MLCRELDCIGEFQAVGPEPFRPVWYGPMQPPPFCISPAILTEHILEPRVPDATGLDAGEHAHLPGRHGGVHRVQAVLGWVTIGCQALASTA